MIDHGQLIADDTPARLKAEHATDRITLTFGTEEQAGSLIGHPALGIVAGGDIRQVGETLVVEHDGGAGLAPKLLRSLDDALVDVSSVEVARPTLDDVFLNLTGRSLRENAA
ncbi:DUF4162 domain-containing protein [Kibdelosporangium lantanae]|uniref:DUF4162 domain-containing protein n=1 Tax=Kibdelosporangium lantanae TaxID=1497396 RepID=A0ABW3M7Y4_9PSEU